MFFIEIFVEILSVRFLLPHPVRVGVGVLVYAALKHRGQ